MTPLKSHLRFPPILAAELAFIGHGKGTEGGMEAIG